MVPDRWYDSDIDHLEDDESKEHLFQPRMPN